MMPKPKLINLNNNLRPQTETFNDRQVIKVDAFDIDSIIVRYQNQKNKTRVL